MFLLLFCKKSIGRAKGLTEHPFGTENLEDVGGGVVFHGDPAGVAGGHRGVVRVGEEGAVGEGPQHVEPRLAGAVHERPVDPRRYVVKLQ